MINTLYINLPFILFSLLQLLHQFIYRRCILSLLLVLLTIANRAPVWGYETNHIVKPNANFETTASNGACLTYSDSKLAINCNPAIFPMHKTEAFNALLIGKAEGPSVSTARTLIFEDVTKEFLENLFKRNNFTSWSMDSNLTFYTPYFVLAYSPYYILTDILIFNPAFPQISLLLVQRNTLRITSGEKVNSLFKLKTNDITLSVGSTLSLYNEKYLNKSFGLLDLAVNGTKDILRFEKRKGIELDLGLLLKNETKYLPNIGLVFKNLGINNNWNSGDSNTTSNLNASSKLIVKDQFETTTHLGLGYNWITKMGLIDLGLNLPFKNIFSGYLSETASMSFKYSMGFFSFYASASKYADTLGLLFASSSSSIGILYSYEKEIRNYNINRDDAIYLSLSFTIH